MAMEQDNGPAVTCSLLLCYLRDRVASRSCRVEGGSSTLLLSSIGHMPMKNAFHPIQTHGTCFLNAEKVSDLVQEKWHAINGI